MAVHLRNVVVEYSTEHGPVRATEPINLDLEDGTFTCVVGPSGCGKTSLLLAVAGLVEAQGEVDLGAGAAEAQPTSMVFQRDALFPWLTVHENVRVGLHRAGLDRGEEDRRIEDILVRVGLDAQGHRHPSQLSGGMRQRAGLARALVGDASILLLDEPFSSLDAQTTWVLQDDLLRLWNERRPLVLFVTHDIDEAILLADRVLVMSARPGRIVADIRVDLPRPRGIDTRDDPRAAAIRHQIWDLLEADVRASFGATT